MSKSIRTEDGLELEIKEGQIIDADGHTLGPRRVSSGPQVRVLNLRSFPVLGLIGGAIAIVAFGGLIAAIIGIALTLGLITLVLRPVFSLIKRR